MGRFLWLQPALFHDDVESPEGVESAAHRGIDVGPLRDVGGDGDGRGADFARDRFRAVRVDVEHGDAGAFSGVHARDLRAESRSRSRHDGGLVR
jgi:hypothetical protein